MNKSELLAQLAEARKARAIEVEQTIETRKLEGELNYINSERYVLDAIVAKDNATLSLITKPLAEISDKHFTLYSEFNFGHQANALIGAIRCVMLQKKLGFVAVEEASMLSTELATFRDLVDEHATSFPDAIGRNTYLDKLSSQIVPGTVGTAADAVAILETLARHIGLISPDFRQVNQPKFSAIEERSVIKAQQAYEDNQLLEPSNNEVTEDTDTFKSV